MKVPLYRQFSAQADEALSTRARFSASFKQTQIKKNNTWFSHWILNKA